ncbi:MAG: hypothetical protein K2X84_07315 [Beijerinckiaceae bacterium]|nr:hypothetical protein [Beijerinckiaceae bacterium]
MATAANITTATSPHLPRRRVAHLSMTELSVFYDAISQAADALIGVMGQPRCLGAAHDAIEDEVERCNDLTNEIIEEVKLRRPVDSYGAALRLQMLTKHFISDFTKPMDLINFVASLDAH